MALVLAIEPNAVQADTLRHLLRTRADTDVVVVRSTHAAVAAIDERVPDLVLVGSLLSPRDEDPFIAHLRTLPDAGHLQTLTIPKLRQRSDAVRRVRSIFSKRKTRRTDKTTGGCDPTQFGNEVAAHLARACEVKAEIQQRKAAIEEEESPVADRLEPAGARSSASVERPLALDASRSLDTGPGLTSTQDECEGVPHRVACTPDPAENRQVVVRDAQTAADTLATELAAVENRHRAEIARLETQAAESRDTAAREAQTAAEAQADETLAAGLDRVRVDAVAELAVAEERHRAEIARLETQAAENRHAAARAAQTAAKAQAAETLATELGAVENRHRGEIARLETQAAESRDAAAREAQTAAEAQADETLAAGLDRVRVDAAAEFAVAEERHRAEIARLETQAAESRDTATREAHARAEAQADDRLTAELAEVRAETNRMLATELAVAEERHRAKIARLESRVAESRDTATREVRVRAEAQADDRLAAELARVREDTEQTLAAEFAVAEERHRAEIARLETEAAESRNAAARDAQAKAEALADDTLATHLHEARDAAARTLAAELAAAEERHCADIARLEAEAADKISAATREARAAAAALADDAVATERERVHADADRTLATQLAAAQQRHYADIARLEAEATKKGEAATRDAQDTAGVLADQKLRVELARVGADTERTLAAQLAAVEERHRADIARLEAETAASRASITRLETEAGEKREAATRDARAVRVRDSLAATAPSTSISLRPIVEPVQAEEEENVSAVTDYYKLWRIRRAAADKPVVEAGVARPLRVDSRRRRWALSVAATLLILLTNNLESGSAPRHGLAAVETAGVGPAVALDQTETRTAPMAEATERLDPSEPAAEDTPSTGVRGGAPLGQLAMEAMCVLVVMLLLRLALFVGEGFVWHGLVATLALILLGFAALRVPWGG